MTVVEYFADDAPKKPSPERGRVVTGMGPDDSRKETRREFEKRQHQQMQGWQYEVDAWEHNEKRKFEKFDALFGGGDE